MSLPPAEIDRLRVRYATFRDRPLEERAALAHRLRALVADERVLIDTCHRVELVAVEADPTDPGDEVPADLVVGRAAVRRVFEVVGGFDSAVVAEEQLLGQVRRAFEAALAAGTSGPILNELFRRALRFGRRVRSHARPGADRSLADRGVAWLGERLPTSGGRVVVAGTGEMGRIVATQLARRGHRITVVSASPDRGARLVRLLEGDAHRLVVGDVASDLVGGADAVVLALRARGPAVDAPALGAARPWLLDLSTPAAIDADAARLLGDRLLTVDAVGLLGDGTPILDPAIERRLLAELDEEVEAFGTWLDTRQGADALAVLHAEADAVRRRHVDRLRRRARLDDAQLAAVEAASAAMVGELLRGPTVALRRGGADAPTVRRLFGLEP